jgi:hypothetical protein
LVGLFSAWLISAAGLGPGQPPTEQAPNTPADTSWVYTSPDHGFTLRLPSSNWRPSRKKAHVADFWCNPLGSPMVAAVASVKKQTEAEFRDTAKRLKDRAPKETDLLVKPVVHEGKNSAGNPYTLLTLCEKGNAADQYVYVAISTTWIKDPGVTVDVLFEGQGKMRSKTLQAVEYAEFEKAGKAICTSVGKAN